MATVNPSKFAALQDSILEFIQSVQERGSKKSADDRARIATHWFLMVQQFAPHVGLGGSEWDEVVVRKYAPQFLPWLVCLTFYYHCAVTDFGSRFLSLLDVMVVNM
jgi:hypothetical protein